MSLTPANNDVPAWEPLIERDSGASAIDLAPGGQWVAYQSDDTGEWNVYIEQYPGLGNRQLVSDADGGWGAYWSADASELYYRRLTDGAMMVVPLQLSPTLSIGAPRVLFENDNYRPLLTPGQGGGAGKIWGLAPDGRFLMLKDSRSLNVITSNIIVVENWVEELKRLVPVE